MRAFMLLIAVAGLLLAGAVLTQTPAPTAPSGSDVFQRDCATCHVNPAADSRAPSRAALASRTFDSILAAITEGSMRIQASRLTAAERRAVAMYLAANSTPNASRVVPAGAVRCQTQTPALSAGTNWNGWGGAVTNTRFQTAEQSGLTAAQIPNLKLKWAFGIDGVVQSRVQPVVVGGRLLVGTETGVVYALDAKSGCTFWTFHAEAGVRTAISVGPRAAYFADA